MPRFAPLAPADLPALPPMRALPSLGDGGEMTLGEERRIGDQIARSIYRDPDYLDDPLLAGYLQQVWRPLLDSAQARGELPPDADQRYAWRLLLLREPSINAFALPGGTSSGPNATAFGQRSAAATSAARQPGSSCASGFRNSNISPFAIRAAWLQPAA